MSAAMACLTLVFAVQVAGAAEIKVLSGSAVVPAMEVLIPQFERFSAVARGDVEIGFNQISEILAAPCVEFVGPLPGAIQNFTLFTAAVVAGSEQVEASKAFVIFISSPAAAAVMKATGFE
jgi:ABC-type molybdate transport system substrate-binding protein